MTIKDDDTYRYEIDASLAIIKRDIDALLSFQHGWQSLSIQMSKLLCDGATPLICRVISDPYFHPVKKPRYKSELKEDRVKYLMWSAWSVQTGGGSMTFSCFDETQPPIPLDRWLDQVIVEANSEPLCIRDLMRTPRDKEAAHSDMRNHKLLKASKEGMTAVLGGESIKPLQLGLGIIGSYVYGRVNTLLEK